MEARLCPLLRVLEQGKILAIDGRCASGKTTMAHRLAALTGAGVVHMDDFYLPAQMRTAERLAAPGGNIHHERFIAEVLPHLRSGGAFSYRIFDCTRMEYHGTREVAASPMRIVEGAYSHHPALGGYADVRVFSDVEASEQLARIVKRNGAEAAVIFERKWIPMEEAYFRAYEIYVSADVFV